MEKLPVNPFPPGLCAEIVNRTLQVAKELETPEDIQNRDIEDLNSAASNRELDEAKSETQECYAQDPAWMIPTNIARVIKASLSERKRIVWYNDKDTTNLENWYLAGRRSAGNMDILRGAPARVRAHYDPYVRYNTIDRRIFTSYEIARYATSLPGSMPEFEGSSVAIIQVPWRHEEFYMSHAYVDLNLRIRKDFVLRRVRFLVVENDMN